MRLHKCDSDGIGIARGIVDRGIIFTWELVIYSFVSLAITDDSNVVISTEPIWESSRPRISTLLAALELSIYSDQDSWSGWTTHIKRAIKKCHKKEHVRTQRFPRKEKRKQNRKFVLNNHYNLRGQEDVDAISLCLMVWLLLTRAFGGCHKNRISLFRFMY